MPPEQALGRTDQVDARSDVWAAGATLYTLLSGKLVHDDAIELAWPKRARFRPRYLLGSLGDVAQSPLIVRDPEVHNRLFGIDTRSDTTVIAKLVLRHKEVFPTSKTIATEGTFAPYDSFYLLAYATAALGERPITGLGLASAIGRLLPPGEPVEVGPAGIYGVLATLAAGKNIVLEGTTTTLDFNQETGDAPATLSLCCLALGGPSGAPAHVVESGIHFDVKTQKPDGAIRCP